jgi:hypothetical protein
MIIGSTSPEDMVQFIHFGMTVKRKMDSRAK